MIHQRQNGAYSNIEGKIIEQATTYFRIKLSFLCQWFHLQQIFTFLRELSLRKKREIFGPFFVRTSYPRDHVIQGLVNIYILTLSPPSTTKMQYANNLDLDEMPSNSACYPDPSCLTLRQHFHQLWTKLKDFEYWSRREITQTTIHLNIIAG